MIRVHKGWFYSFIKCESLKIIEESVLDDIDAESKFSEYFKKVIEAKKQKKTVTNCDKMGFFCNPCKEVLGSKNPNPGNLFTQLTEHRAPSTQSLNKEKRKQQNPFQQQ